MYAWSVEREGIHVKQELKIIDYGRLGNRVKDILTKLENPTAMIITLKKNPKKDYHHVVEKSAIGDKRGIEGLVKILDNVIKKYPWTEQIVIEGGHDLVLYGGSEFETGII